MLVPCPSCGISRELSRDRGTKCKPCQIKSRRGINWTEEGYKHKCLDCEVEWLTKNDTKATRCKSCATKINSVKVRKKPEDYKVYPYECEGCKETVESKAHPKY